MHVVWIWYVLLLHVITLAFISDYIAIASDYMYVVITNVYIAIKYNYNIDI